MGLESCFIFKKEWLRLSDTYWNAPAEKPASAVAETGGGGYILFVDCEEGGWRVPKIWRYEVYRSAPTLQLVRDS